ncbi:hypothetical protein [Microbacterium murale]|uniref:BMP family ABC transporter substrate-binding protein n=1 Tax=Microbacterium murale TaxID=1081040 RepID=A0ABQ1REY1_9MICO|nr:hypothetical protein [Microbacterium murale]GGD68242.1 hypothetical protein GCM10007269_09230 [Microbacterium murale]
MRHRLLAAVLVAVALVLTGCAVGEPNADTTPSSAETLDPQLVPGSTLDASAVTDAAADGLRLAVVAPAEIGEQEQAALDEIDAFAGRSGGSVVVHPSVDEALADDADVVVGIGPSMVGAIDLASAANLERSFLVLGSQLAEPTGNVIAVVWPGADERAVFANEELPFLAADTYAGRAIETGLGAFASGLDGQVIALD